MVSLCIFLLLLMEICQVPASDKTSRVTQESGVITTEVGQSVTLKCFCNDDVITYLSWYQQSLGGKLLIVSSQMKHQTEASISPAYKDRFQVEREKSINHLTISHTHLSDSATYYCGIIEFNAIEFGQGVFLHVKAALSNIQVAVLQTPLDPLRLGDSVNLSCAVYAPECEGEQSLYWFRHHASGPAIIHRSEGRCENDLEHRTSCTSNLLIKSVNLTDAGTYYCALASCGQIVFGNGTKVEVARGLEVSPLLVYWLSVGLAVSINLLLVLACTVCKLKKDICLACKGTVSRVASVGTANHDADVLHYAALSLNRSSGRHMQDDSVCVYSRPKSSKG